MTLLTKEDAAGMTVNERLYHANLLEHFDKAVTDKDRDSLIKILTEIFLGSEDIEAILEKYLKD